MQYKIKVHLLDVDTCYRMAERLYCCISQTTTEDINQKVMILWCSFLWVTRWAEHRKGYHILRTFQNNLLWRLFGLKREDIKGKQRKLYEKELQYY